LSLLSFAPLVFTPRIETEENRKHAGSKKWKTLYLASEVYKLAIQLLYKQFMGREAFKQW